MEHEKENKGKMNTERTTGMKGDRWRGRKDVRREGDRKEGNRGKERKETKLERKKEG